MSFLRSNLAQLNAYVSHPGGAVTTPIDILDTNESPYDLPPELKARLAEHFQRAIPSNRYPDGSHRDLKAAIADYVTEFGRVTSVLSPEQISVGNGSDELIRALLIATCLGGEGSILVAEPTFSMYGILAKTLGIPTVAIARNSDNFAMDLGAAQTAIERPNDLPVRVIFAVHPNSPTGQCLTPAEIAWLQSLPEDILVVIDEAYYEFTQQTLVREALQRPNWVVLRTFSKAFRLAALRVGYAVGGSTIIDALEKVRLPYNMPAFSLVAAQFALEWRDRLLESIAQMRQERQQLYQALSSLDQFHVWPSDANFLHGRLEPWRSPKAEALTTLVTALKAQGTLIRHTGDGLRITVGTIEENERLFTRLANYLEDYEHPYENGL